jgi:hypothetical protein
LYYIDRDCFRPRYLELYYYEASLSLGLGRNEGGKSNWKEMFNFAHVNSLQAAPVLSRRDDVGISETYTSTHAKDR